MNKSPPQKSRLTVAISLTLWIAISQVTIGDTTKESNDDSQIIIFGQRPLPQASGLDDQEIRSLQSATADTATMLKKIPGVNLQQGGGVSGIPVVRGLADDRLRIKVDGMDLISACGNHMNPPLSYIDPSNVASAIVMAGITPVSQGGDSIGSTILIDSSAPDFTTNSGYSELKANAGLTWRTNAEEFASNLGFNFGSDSFAASYLGSISGAQNYHAGGDFKLAGSAARGRRSLQADEVGSSYYQSVNHQLKFAWRDENQLWQFTYGEQDIPEQGWVNQRMDMTMNESSQYNLSYQADFEQGKLSFRLYQEDTRHGMQFGEDKLYWYGPNNVAPAEDGIPCITLTPGVNGCAAGMPMDTEGKNTGLKVAWDWQLDTKDILRLGVELQRYTLNDYWEPSGKGMWPNTFININNGQRDRDAVYAEYETQLSDQWKMQAGLRHESVNMNADEVQGYSPMMVFYGPESAAFNAANRERRDNNLDLSLVSQYSLSAEQTLEVGYSQKTRSPNLYERYTWSTGGMVMRMINLAGDGNGYVGNLNLVPEIAHSISANWRYTNEDWSLNISPYYTQVDDYIDARRCQSSNMNCGMMNQTLTQGFVYLQFINQSAKIHGLDISYRHSIDSDNGMFFEVTYSLTKGENRRTGDNLTQIMPMNIDLALEYRLAEVQQRLELEYVSDREDVSAVRNEVPTDAYTLVHWRGEYSLLKRLNLNFGIENLFDKFYNHPLSGAYLGQGKTMPGTAVPWGVRVPGKGRNIYLAMNYNY